MSLLLSDFEVAQIAIYAEAWLGPDAWEKVGHECFIRQSGCPVELFEVPDRFLRAAFYGMRLDKCLNNPAEIADGGQRTRHLMERIAVHLAEFCPPVGYGRPSQSSPPRHH